MKSTFDFTGRNLAVTGAACGQLDTPVNKAGITRDTVVWKMTSTRTVLPMDGGTST